MISSFLKKGQLLVISAIDWLLKQNSYSSFNKNKVINNQEEMIWTGKPIELLEMALSIHESCCINNGRITQKAVVNWFFDIFGLKKTSNYSSTYGTMRIRTDSRTLFLDKLKYNLENKMDNDDERDNNRKRISRK